MGLRPTRQSCSTAAGRARDDRTTRDADEEVQPEHSVGDQGARAAAALQRRGTDVRRLQGGPRPSLALARLQGELKSERWKPSNPVEYMIDHSRCPSSPSQIVPSPDWVVGVSKENLCQADGTWAENRVIDLFPWDIGTESGLRYDSPSSPSRPRQPIQRITSSNPNNPQSPFFDATSNCPKQ